LLDIAGDRPARPVVRTIHVPLRGVSSGRDRSDITRKSARVCATLLGYGVIVLDAVDGELARINGTSSPEGTYLEILSSQFAQPYVLACMSIGLFIGLGGMHVLVTGLGAVLGSSLAVAHTPMVRAVAWECSVQRGDHASYPRRLDSWLKALRRVAQVLLITRGLSYLPQVSVTSLIDAFTGGFEILGLAFNARLAWLTVFALGTLAAAVVRATVTLRRGIENAL
jgi:phosphatidylglycerophosphate synthase